MTLSRIFAPLTAGLLLISASSLSVANYTQHPKFNQFIQEASAEHKLDPEDLRRWINQAEKQQAVLDAIAKPAEKTIEWDKYQDIFLTPQRIKAGKAFLQQHQALLAQAEQEYGVDRHIIAAIIGVETFYGTRQGSYRVLDSLATLAFDYPERPLFWREFKALFALANQEQLDLTSIKGSYAGAMGFGQFIPTSYLHYAVDGDQDGKRDLVNSPADAIFSVANYFKRHGWRSGESVTQRVHVRGNRFEHAVNDNLKPQWKIQDLRALGVKPTQAVNPEHPVNLIRLQGKRGAEFWLGEYNFYVITRYNHSRLYAMAVYQLSEALR